MIPMEISPEEYVQHHEPTADYIIAVRRLENYDKIGKIHLTEQLQDESRKFVSTARVIAISPYESTDEYVEKMKAVLRENPWIMFEYHVVASVHLLPQFKFPKEDDVVMLHVKDITVIGKNLDKLIEKQKLWEAQEDARLTKELDAMRKSVKK